MRSRTRTLVVLAIGACLIASSASALPTTYYMTGGSQMAITTLACAPCTVPVTGSVTLDDDDSGNVVLTDVSLAHEAYEVALPSFVSIVLDRNSIGLAAGSVAGTGSTLTSAVFGPAQFAHAGTITCISGSLTCASVLNIPDGTFNLPSPVTVNLGAWTFDGAGGLSASFLYTSTMNATETMTLIGSTTPIPEPGTMLLVAAGLAGLALSRRR